jgi:hypothetical protein
MDKIITALDYAKQNGCKTVREHLEKIQAKMKKRYDTPLTGTPKGKPVAAEINFGRWIARCPDCNGAEDVDPNEPIFYCFSCGNFSNNGRPRSVIFPPTKERKAIEAEILKRPVKIRGGANELERMVNAVPEVVTDEGILSRSWLPGETVDEIKRQNKPLKAGK